MADFTVHLSKRGYGGLATVPPAGVVLTPQRWSASDRGGMKDCNISATGDAQSLVQLTGWLGDNVQVYSPEGQLVWYGILWDIEVIVGNALIGFSMDDIYNRVACTYAYTNADGSQESRTTDFAENADSVERYGKRELLHGLSSAFRGSAETVRDNILAVSAVASPIITTESSNNRPSASLTARGLWSKAAAVYFTNLDGLVEHKAESSSIYIGYYMESDEISFGTLTPGGEADEIHIATGDFDPLTTGDTFTISGAAEGGNNGDFVIDHQDSSNQIAIGGSFVAEAAGEVIRISFGDTISYSNVAQSFETTTNWTATHVAVKVRQVGSPSDSFRIGIYPDSAGVPGTVLGVKETLGSELFTDLSWTEFELVPSVDLVAGTTYWLAMRRTGTISLEDGYEVALDEGLEYADGALKVYDGSTWITRTPDTDMPFRIIGEIDSTEQIEEILAVVDDFGTVLMQADSNVRIRQFIDDERTAIEELETMLDAGTDTGQRLVAWVNEDGKVIVTTATEAGFAEQLPVLGIDGRLRFGVGGLYPMGQLIFGRKIELESLMLTDGASLIASRDSSIYVTESTYDASSGTLTIESEGARNPWAAFETRQG